MTASLDGRTIEPMKAKVAEITPRGDQWVYELKWDGMRVVLFVAAGKVRVQSSNLRDVTASFPELASLGALNEDFESVVLDGEIVAFEGNRPSFNALQRRMHVADPTEAARRANSTPILFVAFDLLHLNGHDTTSLPLRNRRSLLQQINDDNPVWTICEQYRDEDLAGLLDVVEDQRLEGIMAKRVESLYQPGRRSPDWIKIKARMRQEFIVGGWRTGEGNRKGGIGSLVLGFYEDGRLLYAGCAGSGLTEASQRDWLDVLVTRHDCPFAVRPDLPRNRTTHWCEPTEVVEVAFGEWPPGLQLRHPVVLGRRTDKDPTQVVREH